MIKETTRLTNLGQWLQSFVSPYKIEPIPGDASFRLYYRVFCEQGTYIAVDAPPHIENNLAFVCVANAFRKQQLNAPEVLANNFKEGFLLLSDLGDLQLLKIINLENADTHYREAIDNLSILRHCKDFGEWCLPLFDEKLLLQELSRFHEWYLSKHLNLELSSAEFTMLQATYELLISSARNQPQVCVHRDYHSRNLMVLPDNKLGILDFQDAVMGPISYDVVSLLKDCYITWPEEKIASWLEYFWSSNFSQGEKQKIPFTEFTRLVDWMGLQRHLKVLGIFARLYLRDHKASYLQDIPRILKYVITVCERYHEFATLNKFLQERVLPHESNDTCSGAR